MKIALSTSVNLLRFHYAVDIYGFRKLSNIYFTHIFNKIFRYKFN